jgi:hypothetical protein
MVGIPVEHSIRCAKEADCSLHLIPGDHRLNSIHDFQTVPSITNKTKIMNYQHWKNDWHICKEDRQLSAKLIPIFESYMTTLVEKGVSKSTFNRHESACHALGGYIISEIYGYELEEYDSEQSGKDVILQFIDQNGGPLVHHDEEIWQKELDAMCKKLYYYLRH